VNEEGLTEVGFNPDSLFLKLAIRKIYNEYGCIPDDECRGMRHYS
jgi:hypothetical protein